MLSSTSLFKWEVAQIKDIVLNILDMVDWFKSPDYMDPHMHLGTYELGDKTHVILEIGD